MTNDIPNTRLSAQSANALSAGNLAGLPVRTLQTGAGPSIELRDDLSSHGHTHGVVEVTSLTEARGILSLPGLHTDAEILRASTYLLNCEGASESEREEAALHLAMMPEAAAFFAFEKRMKQFAAFMDLAFAELGAR